MHTPSLTSIAAVALLASPLFAQYVTDFEAMTASPSGTIITGQDGFYIPSSGGYDGMVYTYAGNTIGIPTNPNGGANFYSGLSTAVAPNYVRAQRDITFPPQFVTIESDILVDYVGTGTPGQYPCSLSLQDSTAALSSNIIAGWQSTAPPYTWELYVTSTATAALGVPAFQNLDANVWHHWGCTIDLVNEVYVQFWMTNGTTNVTTYYTPPTPMPLGNAGQTPPFPLPTGFRLFTGGSTGDNRSAVDNLVLSYGANYATFGAGCAGSLGVPTLAAQAGSMPTLGGTFTAELANLPLDIAFITSGYSNTSAVGGSFALPYALGSVGFPGCDLLVDPVVTEFLLGSSNMATWTFNVPAWSGLAGVVLYQQGVVLDGGTVRGSFTNGGKLSIGY